MSSNPSSQQELYNQALAASAEKERFSCIKKMTDRDLLEKLNKDQNSLPEPGKILAKQQWLRLLSGNVKSDESEASRVAAIKQLAHEDIKSVALMAKCKAAADQTLLMITATEDLLELCVNAAAVHVRKSAASTLIADDNKEILSALLASIQGKDKTLTKMLEKALEDSGTSEDSGASKAVVDTPAEQVQTSSKEAEAPNNDACAPQASVTQAKAPENDRDKNSTLSKSKQKSSQPPAVILQELADELARCDYKNTNRVYACKGKINTLKRNMEWLTDRMKSSLAEYENTFQGLLTNNDVHQAIIAEDIEARMTELGELLEKGNTQAALKLWDKVQDSLNNLNGQHQAKLQNLTNDYRSKLREMKDSLNFASTEKKKTLISRMQDLHDSTASPVERAKQIRAMHDEWKHLGHSSNNGELWKEFKTLSDEAYAPCKEHFKERKKLFASNLEKRRELCEQLEKQFAEVDKVDTNISLLSKILNQAESDWKKYAPVEQAKLKSVQKQFYGVINQFRQLRREHIQKNAGLKQSLVEQATTLIALEDRRAAMEKAKELQLQWKSVGPTIHRDDQKYWEQFRVACDNIFAKKKEDKDNNHQELKAIEQRIVAILADLAKLADLDEEDFRNCRNQYRDLQQQFSAELDPRIRKQRAKFLDQFNAAKRKVDLRFKQLPDKKELLLIKALDDSSTYCLDLENKLLSVTTDEEIQSIVGSIDQAQWAEFDKPGQLDYQSILDKRYTQLLALTSTSNVQQLVSDTDEQLRTLCIEAEILCNIASPDEDQSTRMQIQLQQLKTAFGKKKTEKQEDFKLLRASLFKAQCLGPVTDQRRTDTKKRLTAAINKLA